LGSVLIDQWSSRIREPHEFRSLVERLTGSIILSLADDFHVEVRVYADKLRVASAHRQAQEWEPGMWFADEVRQHVRLHMVNLNQRDVQRCRHPFGEGNPHQKSTH